MRGLRPRYAAAELACLVAFALFIELSWLALFDDGSLGRGLLAVVLCAGLALALPACGRIESRALRRLAAAALTVLAMLALAISAGVAARLLLPGNWSELGDGLSAGLRGASEVSLPYAGGGEWIRISIMLIPALLLGAAAALAFWPGARRGSRGRIAALVVLVAAYAIAAAWYAPPGQLPRGVALTILICAWLWLPGLGRRPVAIGLATVLAAALLVLPVAAAADRDGPLLDYRSWRPLGGAGGVHFEWTHSYGPLNWPQHGTEMLRVKSPRPLYWKAEVLDSFTGTRWARSSSSVVDAVESRPGGREVAGIPRQALNEHPDWIQEVDVSVEKLNSRHLIGSGIVTDVKGVRTARPGADGTTLVHGEPLREGDDYTFKTYAPSPTTIQLRHSGIDYPTGIERFTRMDIPFDEVPTQIPGTPPRDSLTDVAVPPGAGPADLELERRILTGSRYLNMFQIARRVTANRHSPYAKTLAIQKYLLNHFRYEQKVPEHQYPLPAFIGEDKKGYCQQFSGTMALMLRMVGIPSRVATGFSTGETNGSNNSFIVRDLDAHSWVETYFPEVGWVTFDPTPPSAPAVRANSNGDASSAAFFGFNDQRRTGSDAPAPSKNDAKGGFGKRTTAIASGDDSGSSGLPWALLLAPLVAAALWRERRRRRLLGADPYPQLDELSRLDAKLGGATQSAATLLEVERHLGRVAGNDAAGYAAALREHRYGVEPPPRPGSSERRALRRALVRRGGPVGRLRAWRLLPPGGPSGR